MLVSTYLRAVNVRHRAVLLAHCGRLGPAFDACVQVTLDLVSLDAHEFLQAFNLVLDGIVHGEETASN